MKGKNLVQVFEGSPWEIAAVTSFLSAAKIENFVKDERTMIVKVPIDQYVAASKLLSNRI
jgi:hypothetical protein